MYKILVVDDFLTNAMVIKSQLDCSEYDVQTLTSGKQMLAKFEAGQIADLVLLDINMPDMDGIEVLKRVRAIPELRKLPIIFVTGIADRDKVLEGFREGIDDVIAKPTSVEFLRERVRRALLGQTPVQQYKKTMDTYRPGIKGDLKNLYTGVIEDFKETLEETSKNSGVPLEQTEEDGEKVYGVDFTTILNGNVW